jgi:hypothetical protein
MKSRSLRPLGLVLCLLHAVRGALAEDVIQLAEGGTVSGRVLALGSSEVKYQEAGGGTVTLAARQVAGVTLDDSPPGVRQGDESLVARDHDRAIAGYQAALADLTARKSRELNRQFIRMKLASAWRARGSPDDALRELKKLREECGDAWLRADSFALGLEIARQKKDDAAWRELIAEMQEEEEPIRGSAELESAKLALATDPGAAQKTLARLGATDEPYAVEARLWNLRALRALKSAPAMEEAARAGIETGDAGSPALLQAAHATLAMLLLEKAGKDGDRLREAWLESLRALSLGPPGKQDSPEDHALALLTAARSSAALAKAGERKERAAVERARAAAYYREVLKAYPRTEWAKAAQAESAGLGPAGTEEG